MMYLLLIICTAGSIGCQVFTAKSDNSVIANPPANTTATPTDADAENTWEKIPVVQLQPQREAALKRGVTSLLTSWQSSIETKNRDAYLRHYADDLDVFYLLRNVKKTAVSDEWDRAFKNYDKLKLEISNLDIRPQSNDEATMIFDKKWEFSGAERFSSGALQQIIQVRRFGRRWQIVSERDYKVYEQNNRRN